MIPEKLSYMNDFMQKFKEMVLFNTIVNHNDPNGLTYYDLTQIDPNIPHSRIYRSMKKLEKEGFLKKKEVITELGRPKHYFSLTQKGIERHEELKKNLLELISLVQKRLIEDIGTIDFSNFPRRGLPKFHVIDSILEEDISSEEKIEELTKLEIDFKDCLEKIAKAKKKLEKITSN